MSVDPATHSALVGETVSYTFMLVSSGVRSAQGVTLTLGGGSFFTDIGATPSQGSCAGNATSVSCNLGDIPTGASAQVVLQGHATKAEAAMWARMFRQPTDTAESSASAVLIATPTRDLAIDVSTALRYAVVGSPST